MRKNVYAYTSRAPIYPEFISVNTERPGVLTVTVRAPADGENCGAQAEITLHIGQVAELAHALNRFIGSFTSDA